MLEQNLELNQNLIDRVAIGDLLRRRARDTADEEAIVDFYTGKRTSVTYQELNAQVNKLGRAFRSVGLNKGDKLALLCSNRIEFMTVAFACYKTGIVFTPINYLQTVNDTVYNLEHAKVDAIVFEHSQQNLAIECADIVDSIKVLIDIDTDSNEGIHHLPTLIAQEEDGEIEDTTINDRETAQLLYTSGTTANPKGVETSHLSLYFSTLNNAIDWEFTHGHVHLVVLPTFHCAALSLCLTTLQMGGKLIFPKAFDADLVLKLIETEKVQGTALLPMMWRALLASPNLSNWNYDSLTSSTYTMSAMDSKTLDKLRTTFGSKFHLGSGQSEFCPGACIYKDGSSTEFGEGNYWGMPTRSTDQAILDNEGNELAQGEVGEICWRGPQVMNGYLDDPEATKDTQKFGWHHSGDLGLIDEKGQLLFVDRKKDMIKSGGENVSSAKVEQVILEMPEILQVAVFGVPHPKWSEAVCTAIQISPDFSDINEASIINHCKQHLGNFEVPKKIFIVDHFNLTGTGKVKKAELRQQYADTYIA